MTTSVMCPYGEGERGMVGGGKERGSLAREESEVGEGGREEALSSLGLQGSYCGLPCGGF